MHIYIWSFGGRTSGLGPRWPQPLPGQPTSILALTHRPCIYFEAYIYTYIYICIYIYVQLMYTCVCVHFRGRDQNRLRMARATKITRLVHLAIAWRVLLETATGAPWSSSLGDDDDSAELQMNFDTRHRTPTTFVLLSVYEDSPLPGLTFKNVTSCALHTAFVFSIIVLMAPSTPKNKQIISQSLLHHVSRDVVEDQRWKRWNFLPRTLCLKGIKLT